MNTRTITRTARAAYRCEHCRRRAIRPGHRYRVTTFFPGHDINSGSSPFSLKTCMGCAGEFDWFLYVTVGVCGAYCCGEAACARPVHHSGDCSCREDALRESAEEISQELARMSLEVEDRAVAAG